MALLKQVKKGGAHFFLGEVWFVGEFMQDYPFGKMIMEPTSVYHPCGWYTDYITIQVDCQGHPETIWVDGGAVTRNAG